MYMWVHFSLLYGGREACGIMFLYVCPPFHNFWTIHETSHGGHAIRDDPTIAMRLKVSEDGDLYIVMNSGFSIRDGTLLHSKSQYTTVKHSRQLL
jgi:hypothetical protein